MKAVYGGFAVLMTFLASCKNDGGVVDKSASSSQPPGSSSVEAVVDLHGAGATFPYPLYTRWASEYQRFAPRVRINYQSIGSGGGIRQITEKTVDFGASDAFMTDAELAKAPGKLLHVPAAIGAVAIAYNLPEVAGLQLNSRVVAEMFLGLITSWNDPRIAKLNPGTQLPERPITIAYRTDGSGTTAVFTAYLSKTHFSWKEKVGTGKSVSFPVGLGAKGNEGVAGLIKTTPGSVGYLELAYAKQTGLHYAAIANQGGRFVQPSLEGMTAAAASMMPFMSADLRSSIVDAPGDDAYPISAITFLLVYEEQADGAKGRALARFLWWATHDGQKFGPLLDYAPLPPQIVAAVEKTLKTMRSGGRTLLEK